jgi:N-acetyl-gamma-glutamyl-phosphate reductase
MISIGIIGGSGYTGKKLLQFCNSHSFVSEYKIYAQKSAGQFITDLFPDLEGQVQNSKIESISELSFEHDVYFIALPHGEALKYVPALINSGKKVIDLGGDYRLNSENIYEKWYGIKHSSPALLKQKTYGLADYYGTNYSNNNLIANPGCYPTAVLLSLLPLVEGFNEHIISASVAAYSGTSGAGKTPKLELMMSEMDGDVSAYNVNKHRHQPEIIQMLNQSGFNSAFSFTTHLLPISVGIYSTASIHLKENIKEDEIKNYYNKFYSNSQFVRMRETPPHLQWVVNSNFCDINISVNNKVLIISTAIDNLIKGASGQAVQNMNKMFGFEESLGLGLKGVKDASIY